MSENVKGAVPKFGSFKPKSAESTVSLKGEGEPGRQSDGRRQARSRDCEVPPKSIRLDEERHRHREDRNDRREHHKKVQVRKRRSPSPKVATEEFEESDLFIVDRRGDAKNVEYGSLHRYSVPAYHRSGYGHVIGTSASAKIDRDASSEKELVIRFFGRLSGERPERALTAKSNAADPRTLRLIVPASGRPFDDVERDFIEFRPSLKRKRGSESPIPADRGVDYRSIEGKATPNEQPGDAEFEYASESDVVELEDAVQRRIRQVNAELNKKVKQDPSTFHAWLALIEHQSKVVKPGTDPSTLNNSEKRTIAAIRLSIYERALKHITRDKPGHERLLLGSIEEGSLIWESSKLAAKWDEALKDNPSSIVLWTRYLDYVQTDHVSFRYERSKMAFVQCLSILDSAHAAASPTGESRIASARIYVFLRLTSFARDAGYEEFAYVLWQILLEYHFFKRTNLIDRKEELESLEAFWESDVPRIGEVGALGWSHWAASGSDRSARQTASHPTTMSDPTKPFVSFCRQEHEASKTLLLPAATDDDSETSDPFRFVMFSDLREAVECLCGVLPKVLLLNAFLCFMRLPPLHDGGDESHVTWRSDPFLRQLDPNEEHTSNYLGEKPEFQNERITTFDLFSGAFSTLPSAAASTQDVTGSNAVFTDRVLVSLVTADPANEIPAEYYLAFKLHSFPQEAAKTAKRLLKATPSSLRLYNAYALIEARLGRASKAHEVWSAALQMAVSLPGNARDDAILLWHSWIMTSIHNGNETEALTCLISIPDGAPPAKESKLMISDITAGQRLKASLHFEENFEKLRLNQKSAHAVLFIECLAWLSYLLEDHDLEPPRKIFNRFGAKLTTEKDFVAVELVHQARASLLQLHMENKRPYRPGMIKDELAKSIKLFPQNSLFLAVFPQVSAQTRIDDRLRDAVQKVAEDIEERGLIPWSCLITQEIQRHGAETPTSTQNSVRTLLATALLSTDSKVKHSPALWTVWFRFEASLIDSSPRSGVEALQAASLETFRRVQQVFYDGLRLLPWYKPWIIMGLSYFGQCPAVGQEQLRRIYDVLNERELRIRIEVCENMCT